MKLAKINDGWKDINSFNNYRSIIKDIKFSESSSFDDFTLPVSSAITAICGRNGVGKSNLLKSIYSAISGDSSKVPQHLVDNLDAVEVSMTIRGSRKTPSRNLNLKHTSQERLPVGSIYFDPSEFSFETLEAIKIESDMEALLESAPKFSLTHEQIDFIKKVLGKRYQDITIYEFKPSSDVKDVESDENTQVYPFIQVTLNGVTYSNENMGAGEHKCLILIWTLLSLEDNSYLFIEEPESFVCPRFQRILMDFISFYSSNKKLTVFLTTHSEHILNSLKTTSIFSLKRKSSNKFVLVNERNSIKYRRTLGLGSPKSHILLVEDDFAELMLEELLSHYRHDLLEVSNFHNMKGESNIYEVSKRISSKKDMKFLSIYDADQRGKPAVGQNFPSVYLPSTANLAPEKDIIQYIENDAAMFAYSLGVSVDDIESILADFTEEHHDWFIELHREFEKNIAKCALREFKRKAIRCWILENKDICDKFIFELDNIGSTIIAKLEKCTITSKTFSATCNGITYGVKGVPEEIDIKKEHLFSLDCLSSTETKLEYKGVKV